ncbi:hypothetical protein SRHO_G00097850 [Serrasalmus rhombeus]
MQNQSGSISQWTETHAHYTFISYCIVAAGAIRKLENKEEKLFFQGQVFELDLDSAEDSWNTLDGEPPTHSSVILFYVIAHGISSRIVACSCHITDYD